MAIMGIETIFSCRNDIGVRTNLGKDVESLKGQRDAPGEGRIKQDGWPKTRCTYAVGEACNKKRGKSEELYKA